MTSYSDRLFTAQKEDRSTGLAGRPSERKSIGLAGNGRKVMLGSEAD